jgi:hypothetical protein
MGAVRARLLAEARGRHAEAPPEGAGEVRRLPVADDPRDVAHGDRGLLCKQLRRDG